MNRMQNRDVVEVCLRIAIISGYPSCCYNPFQRIPTSCLDNQKISLVIK